jgi:hypothetical protein
MRSRDVTHELQLLAGVSVRLDERGADQKRGADDGAIKLGRA